MKIINFKSHNSNNEEKTQKSEKKTKFFDHSSISSIDAFFNDNDQKSIFESKKNKVKKLNVSRKKQKRIFNALRIFKSTEKSKIDSIFSNVKYYSNFSSTQQYAQSFQQYH